MARQASETLECDVGELGFQIINNGSKFREALQILQVWIASEERPARKSSIDASFEPVEGFLFFTQDRIGAGNLVMAVMRMTE